MKAEEKMVRIAADKKINTLEDELKQLRQKEKAQQQINIQKVQSQKINEHKEIIEKLQSKNNVSK